MLIQAAGKCSDIFIADVCMCDERWCFAQNTAEASSSVIYGISFHFISYPLLSFLVVMNKHNLAHLEKHKM